MSDTKVYLENWLDERNSAFLYQQLAEIEKDPRLAGIYRRFVKVEMDHAEKWVEKLRAEKVEVPEFKPSFRTRVMSALAHRFGPAMILPTMQVMEQKGVKNYKGQGAEAGMVSDEASHANLISKISLSSIRGGMGGGALAMLEGRHRSTGGNALRAAVLGSNDGMVSNLSLVMGVAGASITNNSAILIAGLAGLLAGAFSMALGEWLSVQSSRELYQNQIEIETKEIKANPKEEAEELALIYESRGLKPEQAKILASQILTDQDSAIDTLAREELGIDPGELGGSAWEASITSFFLFAVGAVVPVIPFLLSHGITAVILSVVLSTIGLFILGSVITIFTGQAVLKSGLRMVLFGLLAAAITFGLGRLIGGGVGL
jgi:VIT1/CCC1 family predicted Fe2+/Mn2+ transporter